MKSKFAVLLVVVSLVACRNDKNLKRGQQNYDVVQEGSASGVTSTISGPGETPPPATTAPLTGTNADTTTNFTLPATQTDTIAGSMPPVPSAAPVPRPRVIESPRLRRTPPPTATDTVSVPPQTQTTETDQTQTSPPPPPPPSSTDTSDTTHPPVTRDL
jgi:hypothetical protein